MNQRVSRIGANSKVRKPSDNATRRRLHSSRRPRDRTMAVGERDLVHNSLVIKMAKHVSLYGRRRLNTGVKVGLHGARARGPLIIFCENI
ncbi:hypothetical protein EVAR_24221_1 [Eumeta japonica]|uniref:Uncharacterized protein n=1 Tax=Eumeta variegata TaxID=151549 RepID=A0A4C1W3X5_EUMVA|nr:hypothetical protein EVAR_24221_1 [Eumeta japonica]